MTKTFDQIPAHVPVMLDANIVVYALFAHSSRLHEPCFSLLERGARKEIQLHMIVGAVADVIHRAMVLELWGEGNFRKSAEVVQHLKENPETVKRLTKHKSILGDLRLARINILPVTYRDLHNGRQYRNEYGLMTNDSLIVAVMKREKIRHLATNDGDFERIEGIAVRKPR